MASNCCTPAHHALFADPGRPTKAERESSRLNAGSTKKALFNDQHTPTDKGITKHDPDRPKKQTYAPEGGSLDSIKREIFKLF